MATPKEIIFEEEARMYLATGIKKLADVVAFTLGPRGRNISLEKSWGAPTITNDGASIVKDISLGNVYEDMGASMAKEVVQKIKEKCGDGTTTGTLLLRALVDNGVKQISSGASPIGLKRGIDKAVEAITREIEKIAIKIKGNQEIKNIATVSASGDQEIGALIATAMEKVGKDGVITIEESKGTETTLETVDGMQFDRGWISPYLCTNADKMTIEMEKAQILLVDKKISSIHELIPILQQMASTGKWLLIIAEDFEGDVISTLVINKLRGTLKVAAVKAPGFGDRRKAMMEDIAILTGAQVVAEETGMSLKDITSDVLGSAEKVTITKEHTTLVSGGGSEKAIKARIGQIENEAAKTTNSYDKEKLDERKAKLAGGVAVIKVGAHSEPEMKQKKQVYEDALNSTKAAIEEGVVPGGGVALLRAAKKLSSLKLEGDEAIGAKIVMSACEAPIKQIANNAGVDGSVILSDVLQAGPSYGYNALTDKVEDLMIAGVTDPAKVVKYALTYAASVAGIVLISEALIADAKEEEEEK